MRMGFPTTQKCDASTELEEVKGHKVVLLVPLLYKVNLHQIRSRQLGHINLSVGLLSAVALRARCSSSQERSVTIMWDAPYSLNVTNSSHGTRYLVNMTSRDPYTLNAGSESITVPADLPLYNITVTPYNGPEDKRVYGNSSNITIRRCPGSKLQITCD